MRVFARINRVRSRAESAEAGFSLAEVLVALSILVLISVASAPFFYRAFQSEASQGSRQDAVTVAGQRLDYTRALSPTRLLNGRTKSAVQTITSSPGLVDLSQDNLLGGPNSTDLNYDPAATATTVPVVPILDTQTVGNTVYNIRTYIDPCYRSSTDGSCTKNSSNGTAILRVSVDVSWNRIAGVSCASGRPGQCEFVTTSLRDATVLANGKNDPAFDRNVSAPTVTSVATTPTVLYAGQTGSISLNGTNFVAGATFDSSDPNDQLGPTPSNTGISATGPFVSSATTGPRTIVLTNPDGGNASIQYTVPVSHPAVTSATVAAGAHPGGAIGFTVTGTGFYSTGAATTTPPAVDIYEAGALLTDNTASTSSTTVESGSITLDSTHIGIVPLRVVVNNFDGQSISYTTTITVLGTGPVITASAPLTATPSTAVVFTVTGSGFDSAGGNGHVPAITFTESGAPLTAVVAGIASSTTAQFAVTLTATKGPVPVTVKLTNSDGQFALFAQTLTVVSAPVTVTGLSGSNASPGKTVVTITGTGFAPGATASLTYGGLPLVATAVVVNATTITLTYLPAYASGNYPGVSVTVTNPDGGTATLANQTVRIS